MSDDWLVPPDFAPPTTLEADGFRLEPLDVRHNEADHRAWMTSIEHIRGTPGFLDSDWPHPMTPEENAEDLRAHAEDFATRRGFTYTVLDDDGEVIGCVYLYPDREGRAQVHARSWVRADRAHVDVTLWQTVGAWLADAWPFDSVRYASRD